MARRPSANRAPFTTALRSSLREEAISRDFRGQFARDASSQSSSLTMFDNFRKKKKRIYTTKSPMKYLYTKCSIIRTRELSHSTTRLEMPVKRRHFLCVGIDTSSNRRGNKYFARRYRRRSPSPYDSMMRRSRAIGPQKVRSAPRGGTTHVVRLRKREKRDVSQ